MRSSRALAGPTRRTAGAGSCGSQPPVANRRLHLRVNSRCSRALTRRIDRAEARGAFTYGTSTLPLARALRRTLLALRRHCGRPRDTSERRVAHSAATTSPSPRITWGSAASRQRFARMGRGRPDLRAALLRLGARRASPRLAPARTRRRLLLEGARREASPAAYRTTARRSRSSRGSSGGRTPPKRRSTLRTGHPRFASPAAIAGAWRQHALRAIPLDAHRTQSRSRDRSGPGAQARPLAAAVSRLRPATLDVLLYIGGESTSSRAPQAARSHERAPRQPLPACCCG